ncbi:MAG TPA: hypothetical protein VFG66_02070 [Gemmatimonadales bacterium]|nr:hypothetical protein [Gemmatimonadales bacterium]
MLFARMLLPVTLSGAVALTSCGGGNRDQGTETATADSAARAADSAARAATTGAQRIANVMIGKRLGAENRIAEPTFQFVPQDTVYVSVDVQGAPAEGTLAARWLAQNGKTLDSTAQPLTAGETGHREFHLAQAKGWKPGTYLVTLYLNGDSVEAKTFAVRK